MLGISLDIVVHGMDDLDSICWPGVADAAQWDMHVFQTREFISIWVETIGKARSAQPKLVIVSRAGDPVMLLPLCIEKHAGARILRFMDGGVSDFNAPILSRTGAPRVDEVPRILRAITRAIGGVDAIDLRHMPVILNASANPLAALPNRPSRNLGSAISLVQSEETYASDPERRPVLGQMERKLSQAEKRSAVTFEFAPDPSTVAGVVDFLFEHKSKQYLATVGVDALAFPGIKAFFRQISTEGLASGLGCMSVLRIDGDIGAAHLGYALSNRVYYILMADDRPRFAKMSCGSLLLLQNIHHYRAEGKDALDLGIGAEPWKRVWRTNETFLVDHLSASSLKGHVYVLMRRAIADGTMLGEVRRRWRARGSAALRPSAS